MVNWIVTYMGAFFPFFSAPLPLIFSPLAPSPMLQVSQLPFCRTHNWNIFRGMYTTIQIHFQHITSRTFHPPTENMTADKKSWSAVGRRMTFIEMYTSVLLLQNIETFRQWRYYLFEIKLVKEQTVEILYMILLEIGKIVKTFQISKQEAH